MCTYFCAHQVSSAPAISIVGNGVRADATAFVSGGEVVKIEMPKVSFRIVCSKGTYIRSIAHDFGQKLNNGAYLENLRRTKIGDYSVENALSIEEIQDQIFDSEFTPEVN